MNSRQPRRLHDQDDASAEVVFGARRSHEAIGGSLRDVFRVRDDLDERWRALLSRLP